MPGYHNDQFFRINEGTGENTRFSTSNNGGAGGALLGAANPAFVYPDRTVRVEDHRGLISQTLKRGYIRSLGDYLGGGVQLGIKKCQFQFNPSTLTQSVESAQSTLNFMQMDPGQYAVPRATSVNFTFDLLFDRSMELNNKSQVGARGPDEVNPWQYEDPGQVGVLRDLAAFYSVIGQGISADQLDYMQKSLEESLRAEAIASDSETAQEDLEKAIANAPAFLRANAANSAFLLPTPVRAVFSSLYMVEGFVTSTTVTFTKFNTAMVPMQCALSVTMEAKYIGFAQQSTFLTWSLEERTKLKFAEEEAAKATNSATYNAMSKDANKMELWLSDSFGADVPLYSLLSTYGYQFKVHAAIPSSKGEGDSVGLLFVRETGLSVEVQGSVSIYGPYSASSLTYITDEGLAHFVTSKPKTVQASGTINGTNSKFGLVSSAENWGKLVSGTRTNDFFTGNSTWHGAPVDFDTSGVYIAHYEGSAKAHTPDSVVVGEGGTWVRLSGSSLDDVRATFSLKYDPIEETTAVQSGMAPADNAATTGQNQPGSTSKVGSRAYSLANQPGATPNGALV